MEQATFAGLRVAAFESRRADEMARMIERLGGVASVSPSLREVPLADQREAIDFAKRLMTGQVDVVIFLTGVGARALLAALERQVDRQRFLHALTDATTIVRGPKPLAVLREWGIEPTWRVPEPNTWREILKLIDQRMSVANQVVAVQEYGQPNSSLIAGLEARGASVLTVKVYEWDLPEDTRPLEASIRALIAGEIDVALFTSAQQVVNLLRLAQQHQLGQRLREAMERVVVASIGPTTSEALRQAGLIVDLEPTHSKMGHLVVEAAQRAGELLKWKRDIARLFSAAVPRPTQPPPWYDSPFMKACRREPSDRIPIWLMRQAGRYLSEYREIRAKTSFLELCKNPALSAEVMIRAVERLGVDAAIIFSDLLPILEPMGFELEFAHGEGPQIHNPLREPGDVDRVVELSSVEALAFVMETVRLTRAGIRPEIPVIGFAGAPFTLASYAIEGGASRSYLHTKTLMYRDSGAWRELMERLARGIARYLNAQIAAGAQAVQLFDSWVGCLGVDDYARYVAPYTQAVIEHLRPGVPVINFATGNPALLGALSAAGGDVIGIDWRIRLDDAWLAIGHHKAIQGNLDPAVLLADRAQIKRRAKEIVDQAGGRPGHIFNLGHGVLPQTPVDNVRALVDYVHELADSRANGG
jgi:uroporphyrinogen decarboxylase